ncbi:MAG TPA: AMP-binding protein [Syntrophorhabdales bacterium]|nr:AMP-binding protein [Syntrophorhabdales bacterium]
MNIAQNLERSAFFFPTRPAIRQGDLELTYAELNDTANKIATGLISLGIKPGEHVGLCSLNSADWVAFYFGALKAGAVAVTLSGLLKGDELNLLVGHAKPRVIFTSETRLAEMERLKGGTGLEKIICPGGDMDLAHLMSLGSGTFEAVQRDRTDVGAILFTGGTTGVPKGAMLTHEGMNFSSWSIAYYEHSTQHDTGLCFLPFNHVFGQMHILNGTILSAGCLELLPAFDMDKTLELVEKGRVTKFFAVPTVYIRFLSLPDLEKRVGKLRYCFSAAASMAMEIVKQWKERTGITIAESFGQTECMPITFNHYYPERHVVGSVGQPVHGMEVQIRDLSGNPVKQGQEGEICMRGRNVMKGYLDNPEGTRDTFWGDWLRSGDIGVFDREGYLFIVDRLKDLIITGGENVYPREVEEQLYAYPDVEECAVIGLPDKEWGERVAAYIVPKAGRSVATENIKTFLKGKLSSFKVPKEYVIVKELPKSPQGKILKRELRKLAQS